MDISGIAVAASEMIRFEKGYGIILIIYSTCMDIHFYILTKDDLIESWKRIQVTHFYKFSYLKLGAIELLSGTRKVVLVASSKSEFHEILEPELQECNIPRNLLKIISIPDFKFKSEIDYGSKLLSYQGVVTKVKSSKLGIFELDNKIQLYCIFNSLHTILPTVKEGFEVFVSNAHFFTDFKVESDDAQLSVNYSQYSLSIFDVIWLEMLLIKLNTKFYPSVICSNIFHLESEIINNILECFSYSHKGIPLSSRKSLGEEFCSSPHSCDAFCDDILPTGCVILNIFEILDSAFSNISWTGTSDTWKVSSVENQTKYILIGILYWSKNGCWYIMDKSCSIPVVLTQSCTKCKLLKQFFCSLDDLNLGYLVAIQNFDIVFEKIKYKINNDQCYRYLKTSCCYLFHLGTFCKQKNNIFHLVSLSQESFFLHSKSNNFGVEVQNMLKSVQLDKKDLWADEKENSFDLFHDKVLVNNTYQNVLVLNKLWTVTGQKFVCYQVIVLLLPQDEMEKDYFDRSKCLFEDYNDFYETEDDEEEDDDEEFAELVNQMDSLYLEDKPRLARLHFDSTLQCAAMLPGHIYRIDICENFCKDEYISVESDKNNLKPLLLKIKQNMKITHHLECLGNHHPDEYGASVFCSIKEIISKRKVRENCLVQAVVKEKFFEESNCFSQSEVGEDYTFCLIVKDCKSNDCMKVYLPFCPKNIYGLLPGISVQMYGFVCVCSRRGNLYLTPSSLFGIQIVNSEEFHRKDICDMLKPEEDLSDEDLKISFLRSSSGREIFKCLCYIIKIISVKLYLICNSCGSEFEKKCSCLCNYDIKLTMSFIIDDGTDQMLALCTDEAARKVLMLSECEWKKLTSHITERMTCLKFHYKMYEGDPDSLVQQVFSVYCSSSCLCRQIYLKCGRKSGDRQTVWCYDVLQMNEIDLIPEFISSLKNIHT